MSLQKNAGAVWRWAQLLKISAWLQNIPNKVTPPPFRLMQISSAFWQSRALYTAARLDIASTLADTPLSTDEIATRIAADPDATGRLLRLLAAMGIFKEVSTRCYANNKLSAFLRQDNPQNVRAMILMHNSDVMSRPWYEQLEAGIKHGAVPFELTHGEMLYPYMDRHEDFDALFAQAMDSVEALTGATFATDFDWGQFERVIDIGGSNGSKAVAILKRYPQLQALVVDRPQVIRNAERYWSTQADRTLLSRLSFIAGDVLEAAPLAKNDKDIFLVSALLHGLDNNAACQVLKKIAAAIGKTGARIALLELVLDEVQADFIGASLDMQMFMGTRGRERSLREWRKLFKQSGVVLEALVGLRSFGNILVLGVQG